MNAADWFLLLLILLAAAGVAAAVALAVVWRRGNGQIDRALSQILDMRAEEEARRHLRIVRAHELEAKLHAARRKQGDAS